MFPNFASGTYSLVPEFIDGYRSEKPRKSIIFLISKFLI